MSAARISDLARDTRGSQSVEYLVLVGVLALVSIPAFLQFGQTASKTVREQGTFVEGVLPKMGF